MPPLLLVIAIALFGAWLGLSRLFGRKRGSSRSFTGAFLGEATAWLIVFVLGLTAFVGSAFWSAALALSPIALAILGLGVGAIVLASLLTAALRDPPSSRPNRQPRRSESSWKDLWRQYRRERVPPWMRQIDLGDGIELDGKLWTLDDDGTLAPCDDKDRKQTVQSWLDWLLE